MPAARHRWRRRWPGSIDSDNISSVATKCALPSTSFGIDYTSGQAGRKPVTARNSSPRPAAEPEPADRLRPALSRCPGDSHLYAPALFALLLNSLFCRAAARFAHLTPFPTLPSLRSGLSEPGAAGVRVTRRREICKPASASVLVSTLAPVIMDGGRTVHAQADVASRSRFNSPQPVRFMSRSPDRGGVPVQKSKPPR